MHLLDHAITGEAKRLFGPRGQRLSRSLRVGEELIEDEEEEKAEEDERDATTEAAETRLLCALCHEEDRYLCSPLVYGPTLDDCLTLTRQLRPPPSDPAVGVIWHPVNLDLASQEAPLYPHLPLPLHRGSLVSHELCADAVLLLRAGQLQRAALRRRRAAIETVAYMGRGRTCALGSDRRGRLYWQFAAEPGLLFVQPSDNQSMQGPPQEAKEEEEEEAWVVYETDQDIARLLAYLNPRGVRESQLLETLEVQYPQAAQLFRAQQANGGGGEEGEEGEEERGEWAVGEEVVVRGREGLMWPGSVLCVVEGEGETRYRVRVEGWGDLWVGGRERDAQGNLVLGEKSIDAETMLKEAWEVYGGRMEQRYAPPRFAQSLIAHKYVGKQARNRVRKAEMRPKFELSRVCLLIYIFYLLFCGVAMFLQSATDFCPSL